MVVADNPIVEVAWVIVEVAVVAVLIIIINNMAVAIIMAIDPILEIEVEEDPHHRHHHPTCNNQYNSPFQGQLVDLLNRTSNHLRHFKVAHRLPHHVFKLRLLIPVNFNNRLKVHPRKDILNRN